MRPTLTDKLEQGRVKTGELASDSSYGCTGAFRVFGPCGRELFLMSSGPDSATGWEHVSVSTERRIPNWEEMAFVKELFWDDEEAVMQLHPPRSQYVNYHPRCLHLWRPINATIPLPPPILVGPK